MKSRLLLDVIVTQRASILELLSSEDKALLIRGDTAKKFNTPRHSFKYCPYSPFLVLDFGLDVVDGVGGLHLKGDRLPREGLDEDLHLCV